MTKTKKQNQFRKNNRTQKKVRKNRRKQTNKFRKNRRKQNKLRKSQRGGLKSVRNMWSGKVKGMSVLDGVLKRNEFDKHIDVLFKFRALKDGNIRTMYFLSVSSKGKEHHTESIPYDYFLVTMEETENNIHAIYKVKGSVDIKTIRGLSQFDEITRTKPVHALSQIRTIYYMRNMSDPKFLTTLEKNRTKYYVGKKTLKEIMMPMIDSTIKENSSVDGSIEWYEYPDHERPKPDETKEVYMQRMKENIPERDRPPYKSIDASITDICESHNCEDLGNVKVLERVYQPLLYVDYEGHAEYDYKVVKENNKSSWRKENSETESPYEGTECFEQKVVFQTDKVSFDTKLEFTILDFYPFAPHTK